MRIVLDPGHGGKDPGAVGKVLGIKEKDVTLGIAKLLAEKLENAGHEVFLTRTNDEYVSLPDRVAKFKLWQGDLVLSIHINSSEATSASYVSTWLKDTSNKTLYNIGEKLSHACSLALNSPNGGVRKASFYVLKNSPSPACLLEVGFISNPEQERELAKASVRSKIADVISSVIGGPDKKTNEVEVYSEGKLIVKGQVENGVTFVPVRDFAVSLGLKVAWDEKNSRVIISEDVEEKRIIKENQVEILFVKKPPTIGEFKNGTTMAPVREFANMLGYNVKWDTNKNTVNITKE